MKTVLCKDYVGFFSWSFEWKGECVESFAYTETNGQMCFFRERTVKTIQQRVKRKKVKYEGKVCSKDDGKSKYHNGEKNHISGVEMGKK